VSIRTLILGALAFIVVAVAVFLFTLTPPAPVARITSAPPAVAAAPAPAASEPRRIGALAPATEPARPATKRVTESKSSIVPAPPTPEAVEAAPTVGTLHVDADVSGAIVFIDRVFIGYTPVTARNVTLGNHRLNVSIKGYDGYAETIEVAPGPREILVKFKEGRLDAKIDVVHQHAFGSCKGTLSATPDGLRYETTNTNDAFSAALTDIVTFQLGDLDKILTVKLKNGKKYDFAAADGAAPGLSAFFADVDKARARLKDAGSR
jgi:hypothetical protein